MPSNNLQLASLGNTPGNLWKGVNRRLRDLDAMLTDSVSHDFVAGDSYVWKPTGSDVLSSSTLLLTDSVAYSSQPNIVVIPEIVRGLLFVDNQADRKAVIGGTSAFDWSASPPTPSGRVATCYSMGRVALWCDGTDVTPVARSYRSVETFVHSPLAGTEELVWYSDAPFRLYEDRYSGGTQRGLWTGIALNHPTATISFDFQVNGASVGSLRCSTSGVIDGYLTGISGYTDYAAGSYITIVSPADVKGASRIAIEGIIHR